VKNIDSIVRPAVLAGAYFYSQREHSPHEFVFAYTTESSRRLPIYLGTIAEELRVGCEDGHFEYEDELCGFTARQWISAFNRSMTYDGCRSHPLYPSAPAPLLGAPLF